MGTHISTPSSDEKEKKSVPRIPEINRYTLGDYLHSLGIPTNRIFIVDRSSGRITGVVKKILNDTKES